MPTKTKKRVADTKAKPKRPTVRVNIQFDAESYTRLMYHCVGFKKKPGMLLSELVDENLKRFRVSDLGDKDSASVVQATPSDRLEIADQASKSEAA